MGEFTCDNCGEDMCNQSSLIRHKKTIKCSNNIKYYHCKECSKKYINEKGLINHIESGKCKKTKVKGNHNKIISCPKTASPVQQIQLVDFGKDGLNLTYDELTELFDADNHVRYLIKTVNLNPNKPQHHNILYTNLSSVYGMIREGEKEISYKISDLMDTLINAKLEDLRTIVNGRMVIDEYKNMIKTTIAALENPNCEARKNLRSYIKPQLYNACQMVRNTWNCATHEIKPVTLSKRAVGAMDTIQISSKTNKKILDSDTDTENDSENDTENDISDVKSDDELDDTESDNKAKPAKKSKKKVTSAGTNEYINNDTYDDYKNKYLFENDNEWINYIIYTAIEMILGICADMDLLPAVLDGEIKYLDKKTKTKIVDNIKHADTNDPCIKENVISYLISIFNGFRDEILKTMLSKKQKNEITKEKQRVLATLPKRVSQTGATNTINKEKKSSKIESEEKPKRNKRSKKSRTKPSSSRKRIVTDSESDG